MFNDVGTFELLDAVVVSDPPLAPELVLSVGELLLPLYSF